MTRFLDGWSILNALLLSRHGVNHVKVARYKYGGSTLFKPKFIGSSCNHNLFGCSYFKHINIDLRM